MADFWRIGFSSNKGFTLIEVLISLTLISIIVTGSMGLFIFSTRANKNSKTSFDATYLARNNMEIFYELSRTVDLESGIDMMKTELGFYLISPSENLFGKTEGNQYITVRLKEAGNLIDVVINVYENNNLKDLKAKMETLLIWEN